jgi:hypothetical protein
MSLTCVLEIPNPLWLNVKLHHCKKIVNYNHYGTIQIVDWNKKIEKYYKFVNVIALQDFLVLTFENCSKLYDYFNSLSNQIKGPFQAFLKN